MAKAVSLHEVLRSTFDNDDDADAVERVVIGFRDLPQPQRRRLARLIIEEVLGPSRATAPLDAAEQTLLRLAGAVVDDPDAVYRDRGRRVVAFEELMADSIVGIPAMADHLGVSRSRISQMLTAGQLYCIVAADDTRHFPSWQLDDEQRPLRGLDQILSALPSGLHPLTLDWWLRTPHDHLLARGTPVSPRDWLLTGGSPATLTRLAAAPFGS